jgi:hypothetical protein
VRPTTGNSRQLGRSEGKNVILPILTSGQRMRVKPLPLHWTYIDEAISSPSKRDCFPGMPSWGPAGF